MVNTYAWMKATNSSSAFIKMLNSTEATVSVPLSAGPMLAEIKIRQVTLKNVKNEKCTLKDLEYGEKTENHGK